MEIVFLIISLVFTLSVVYLIGRTQYSHKGLIRAYRDSDTLGLFHLFFGMIMVLLIFILLCAFNNTYWHLPYLT